MRILIVLLVAVTLLSCSGGNKDYRSESTLPECTSFLGKPLFRKITDSTTLSKSDSTIAAITFKGALTEDDFILIGRQLVASNRFSKTIENYSQGLVMYPNSFKLLRHRGHRYINLRQLDKAIADLSKAEELIRLQPDVWEYDPAGKPSATYQHQIWYHIGVYHFLNRNYLKSATAFEKCLAAAHEGNNIAGASDWLYNAYQRSGQKDKLENILKPFTLDFAIEDKEYPYFRRLLFYKGLITQQQLVDVSKPIDQMTLSEVTKLYGMANWFAYQGDLVKASEIYNLVVQSKEWPGFAVASAEKDLQK